MWAVSVGGPPGGGVRWVPTLFDPAALGPRGGELHGEGLDMPTTRRYAAFTQSGVGECRGAYNAGPGYREGSPKGKAAGQQVSLRRLGEVCERRGECVLKDPSCIGNNRYLMIDSGVERLLFGLSHPKVSNV